MKRRGVKGGETGVMGRGGGRGKGGGMDKCTKYTGAGRREKGKGKRRDRRPQEE